MDTEGRALYIKYKRGGVQMEQNKVIRRDYDRESEVEAVRPALSDGLRGPAIRTGSDLP